METMIISTDDIRKIVQTVGLNNFMDTMIDRLFKTLEAFDKLSTVIPPRDGFEYQTPNTGLIEWMPVMQLGHQATIKIVGYHPTNPLLQELPTILSSISMYDTANGHLTAIADGTFLTAVRTGAVSAVASQLMASPASKTVGLIGCGAQAVTQLHALSRVFDIESVLTFDVDPAVCHSFSERVSFLNLQIQSAPQDILLKASDILCTATSVAIHKGPVFQDAETKPWLHINAVGSDFPGKVEIPRSLLSRAFVCPDFLPQAMMEGECQQLSQEEIGPELVEVAKSPSKFQYAQKQLSVFDSTGWALEDKVAMDILIEFAIEFGVGKMMQIETVTDDPRNPYHLFQTSAANKYAVHKETDVVS